MTSLALTHDQVGKEIIDFVIDGMETDILFHNGKPISVEIPQTATYTCGYPSKLQRGLTGWKETSHTG